MKNRVVAPKGHKWCHDCEKVKLVTAFSIRRVSYDGLSTYCKSCKVIRKKRYISNPINRINRNQHQLQMASTAEAKAKRVLYRKTRKEKDLQFRLGEAISSGIRMALKGNKSGCKWETLVDYSLDELKAHLEKLFEPGMTWANWGKGSDKWNVDHILPKSRFNYEKLTDLDFKRCWALSNLQPLWSPENHSKHANIIEDFQPSLQLEVI